jgi:hypothetical protein
MKMELFIGGGVVLIYLGIVLVCMLVALGWARERKWGVRGKTGIVVGVLFVAYAIPFGDHTIGLIKFKRLCEEQAGERIYETVDGVDGILWSSGQQNKPYTTYGYSFYETQGKGGRVFRYVQREDGTVAEENHSSPKARFLIHRSPWSTISDHLEKTEFIVEELSSGKPLAIHTILSYSGGWLTRSLEGIGGHGPSCPDRPFEPVRFIHTVLKPNAKE